MRACGYELADGTRCQVETEAAHCELHLARFNRSNVSTPALIRQHLQTNQGTVIDLKGFRFRALDFESTLFPPGRDILFDDSTFVNSRFIDVAFEGNASFVGCTFEGTIFENVCSNHSTIGCAKLDFTLAKFLGNEVPFRDCLFDANDGILFAEATFKGGDSPFWMCNLHSYLVSFFRASIKSDRFYLSICSPQLGAVDSTYLVIDSKRVNLARLRVDGHFEYSNSGEAIGTAPYVSFLGTDFRQMRTATLRDANLTNAIFEDSVIEGVNFINPVWMLSDRGAPMLYDEVISEERTTDEQLLRLLVQLKRNYEEQRDYSMAGKWFYREMECRRRLVDSGADSNWLVRWITRNLFRSYKVVSDYGENLVKPFLLLLGLFVLWGPLYFYSGFGTKQTINYEFTCEVSSESAGHFLDAILYSLGVMSFQVTKTGFQHGTSTSALTLAQVLFTLILVPLFLLALRRKFRR